VTCKISTKTQTWSRILELAQFQLSSIEKKRESSLHLIALQRYEIV
jgi:hypothetical protein